MMLMTSKGVSCAAFLDQGRALKRDCGLLLLPFTWDGGLPFASHLCAVDANPRLLSTW